MPISRPAAVDELARAGRDLAGPRDDVALAPSQASPYTRLAFSLKIMRFLLVGQAAP